MDHHITVLRGSIVEESVELTTTQLCRACGTTVEQVELWVGEGVLEPRAPKGPSRDEWRFGGDALARMKLASRLARDLALDASAVALAMQLLERIAALEARLGRQA